jgi:hypothetical protein
MIAEVSESASMRVFFSTAREHLNDKGIVNEGESLSKSCLGLKKGD